MSRPYNAYIHVCYKLPETLITELDQFNLKKHDETESLNQSTCLGSTLPYCSAQLWPVVQFLQLLAQMELYRCASLESDCLPAKGAQLQNFFVEFGPGNPIHIWPFKLLSLEPHQVPKRHVNRVYIICRLY